MGNILNNTVLLVLCTGCASVTAIVAHVVRDGRFSRLVSALIYFVGGQDQTR